MAGLGFRRFGVIESDLNIDFTQSSRPHLVTQVLKCCTAIPDDLVHDEIPFWGWTVGKRIACLARISGLNGRSDFTVHVECLNQACGRGMDLEISVEELLRLQRRADRTAYLPVRIGASTLSLRKPSGSDQLRWQQGSFDDEKAALDAVIRTLVAEPSAFCEEGPIPDDTVRIIDEAMQEADPLVNVRLAVHCPHCGEENTYEIDLQETALARLHQAQVRLLEDVHRLALHYHWSEQQIISLPPWRRDQYLAFLERERDQ